MPKIIVPQKIHNVELAFDLSGPASDAIMLELDIWSLLNLVTRRKEEAEDPAKMDCFLVIAKDSSRIRRYSKDDTSIPRSILKKDN